MRPSSVIDATVQIMFIHDFHVQGDKDSRGVDENVHLNVVPEGEESNFEQARKTMNARESKAKMRHATSPDMIRFLIELISGFDPPCARLCASLASASFGNMLF